VSKEEVLNKLKDIVGEHNVTEDVLVCVSYAADVVPFDVEKDNIPIAVVKPGSTEEVSRILKYANEVKIPVFIHGSGTSFIFSSRPKKKGSIVLSTTRLNEIKLNEDDMYVEVGAGVRNYDLERFLSKHGYMLPMNIGSKLISTIGGAVSVNTIGHMVDACVGKPADHILGLEVVLPTGEIIETGTKSLRRPAGVDLTKFFVGSEGLLGVITKIRMMLIPEKPRIFVIGYFSEEEGIGRAVSMLYKSKIPPPMYGEFLDYEGARQGFKLVGLEEPKGAVLLLTFIGDSQEEATIKAQKAINVLRNEKTYLDAYMVESREEQERVWHVRDYIINLIQLGEGGNFIGIEVSSPLSRLAELISYLKTGIVSSLNILRDVPRYILGHVGATALHMMWVIPRDWSNDKKKEAYKEAFTIEKDVNIKFEGSCGETGLTAARIRFFKEKYGDAAYNTLLKIKRALDPNNILNPGNLEGEGLWS